MGKDHEQGQPEAASHHYAKHACCAVHVLSRASMGEQMCQELMPSETYSSTPNYTISCIRLDKAPSRVLCCLVMRSERENATARSPLRTMQR